MSPLFVNASPTSPEIDFRFDLHILSIRGESYPENAAAFYRPILDQLALYLARSNETPVIVNVSLAYFNSSSTKMLFALFRALNDAALAGRPVQLNWYHEAEDDTIIEFGEELRDDFTALVYRPHPLGSD